MSNKRPNLVSFGFNLLSSRHWQQARHSESMLVRKQRLLERTEAARQGELLDIEARKAKVLDMDQKILALRGEVEKLEAEAAGGIPQPILDAMGM